MNKKDFAVGIIANNIGTEGTLLEFQAGYGQTMAEVPFHLTLTPPAQITTLGNSEKVLVTEKVDDEKFIIVRAQGDTIARDIKAGWIAGNGIYVEDLPSTPADVQLPNVDNTSDLDKPISTATQTALDGKVSVVAGKGLSANDYTDVEKAKLDTIEENATANSSDEQLRDRAQHTGVQPIQTVQGLEQALGDKQPAGDYATGAQGALADTSLQPGSVAPVALSGSYADLTEKPNIPSVSGFATEAYVNEVGNLKLNLTDVVNNLASTATDKPLSAEQGRQLKVFIDTINTAISSDDTSLDQLQEIVDFIKLNRDELDDLTISGVAGLQAALDGKQPLGNYATAAQGAKADTAVQPTEITDFETSTELDARDAANRLRSNHNGTQAISTVSGLQSALDAKTADSTLAPVAKSGDHGSLTGLADDDHPQYLNITRGDARYRTQAEIATLLSGKADQATTYTKTEVDALDAAHVAATDPHTQYMNSDRGDARYAGRPYAVMAKAKFASFASSYGILGKIFGNSGYLNDLQVYGESTQASVPTPDVPVPIVSTTGNVTVRSASPTKNLFDGGIGITNNFYYDNFGTAQVGAGDFVQTAYIPVLPNTTYTMSQSGVANPKILQYTSGQVFISRTLGTGVASVTVTTGATTAFIRLSGAMAQMATTQLELGAVATAFVPHAVSTSTLPLSTTQLRSLPNGVSDRIYKDGATWKLEQNVGQQVIDGSESFSAGVSVGSPSYTYAFTSAYDALMPETLSSNPNTGLNNRFAVHTGSMSTNTVVSTDTMTIGANENVRLRFLILSSRLTASTSTAVKAYFAANPTTFQFLLRTPITTTLTDPTLITALENIRTYQGITNITASTPVSGSYGVIPITKGQMDTADALNVLKAGDTMTGRLGNATSNLSTSNTRGGKEILFGATAVGNFGVLNNTDSLEVFNVMADGSGLRLGNSTGVGYLKGTGFPNGVVSAPVGSIYIDTAVTNGASSWVKTSGTSNTGWVVENGDTGSRNINSLLEPGALVQGNVIVRLKNNTVSIYLQGVEVSSGSPKTILANISTLIGTSYSPVGLEQRDIPNLSSTASIGTVVAGPSEGIRVIGSTGRFWMAFTYTNNNTAWPTTLPGTAA